MFRKKNKKKKKKSNGLGKNKKKKGVFFKISGKEDLGQILNSQIPYSEYSASEMDSLPKDWKEKDVLKWTEEDVSSFFLSQSCGKEVSTLILQKTIKGIQLLEPSIVKELLGKVESPEKRKIIGTFIEYFKFLKNNELPTIIGDPFASMIAKVFERHNKDNLFSKCDDRTLACFLAHLIDKDLIKQLYFSDKFLLKTINFSKINVMVGTEENKSQIFAVFFHPLLVLIHSEASFSQCFWLENEEGDEQTAVFKDLFSPDGQKFALRYVEFEIIHSVDMNEEQKEEKIINILSKMILRCNRSEFPMKAPEFIERLVSRLSNQEDPSLMRKLKPHFKTRLSNIPELSND